jgi:hypothetical protein
VPNPRLSSDQLLVANKLIDEVRAKLAALTGDDTNYHWALRRKLAKELVYDERGKTGHRVKLKLLKRKEQNEICPLCNKQLPEKYCVLDRTEAIKGYTVENTRLICQPCDHETQKARGYK